MTTWLTSQEAARHCRISLATFRRRVKQGVLPKPNPLKRYSLEALDAALTGTTNGTPGDDIMARIRASQAAKVRTADQRKGA
jgi:hypothetical protein